MEKEHILKSLKTGVRYDGRKLLEFRTVMVEQGVSGSAEGSARVRIGETDVFVGVKMAVEKPYPDTPEKGNLMVNSELRPISNPAFEAGPPGDQSIEIARVVDRGLRESKAIKTESLCITPKEKVWSVMIDICPLNDAGNLLDAAALGAISALKNTKYPQLFEDGTVNWEIKTDKKIPIANEPIEITVLKIGEFMLVDPSPEEESLADARLTIAVSKDGTVHALQKGGETPLTIEEIDKMIEIVQDKSKELRKFIK